MTFDNGKTIIALRLRVFLATILLIIFIFFAYLEKDLKFPLLGMGSGAWTTILLFIYAIMAFYPLAFNYKFFYFSDDGPNLVFRYYPVGIFVGKKSSVEIPKSEFAGYNLSDHMLIFKKLVLARKLDRKVAQYPEIHLSSLRKKEIKILVSTLDLYSQEKQV